MAEPLRRWCARIAYPGRKPVTFGTLMHPHNAGLEEVRSAMLAVIAEHLPDGFEVVGLIPGAIWFEPEEPHG